MIENKLPIHLWRANVNVVSFSTLSTFGQHGLAFIYALTIASNKKLNARAIHVCFFGMEIDEQLCSTYKRVGKQVSVIRLADFKPSHREKLLLVAKLLRSVSRQSEENALEGTEGLPRKTCTKPYFLCHCQAQQVETKRPPSSPQFTKEIERKVWRDAVHREYNASHKSCSWK